MRVILASASPRRRELLEQIGIDFLVKVSKAQEITHATSPDRVVEELSATKARAVYASIVEEQESACGEEFLVIGADTVVSCDGRIFGKPVCEAHAKEMLTTLQGRDHEVYTGVTLCVGNGREMPRVEHSFHECTRVTFFPMTEEEIEGYVRTGDCKDKAGAYGIQGFCARYIAGIEGDYNNVVGLPVGRLYQEMKKYMTEM